MHAQQAPSDSPQTNKAFMCCSHNSVHSVLCIEEVIVCIERLQPHSGAGHDDCWLWKTQKFFQGSSLPLISETGVQLFLKRRAWERGLSAWSSEAKTNEIREVLDGSGERKSVYGICSHLALFKNLIFSALNRKSILFCSRKTFWW